MKFFLLQPGQMNQKIDKVDIFTNRLEIESFSKK